MASLTLSSTSTLARADATGRARLPRITAYRLLARSLSFATRSKCLAILETLPFAVGGRLIVDFGPAVLIGRDDGTFSRKVGRLGILPLLGFGARNGLLVLSVGDVRPVFDDISVFIRGTRVLLSGDDRRDGATESNETMTGPGIRLPCDIWPRGRLECVRYLGAILAV